MGKLNAVDFSVDPQRRYTFWSGLLGGFFLALSYFGTDQSQVQRYLAGGSLAGSRFGLIFNADSQAADAVFYPPHRRDGFCVFSVRKAAALFQSTRLMQRADAERAGGETGRSTDSLRCGLRGKADGDSRPDEALRFGFGAGDRERDERRARAAKSRSTISAAK